MTSTRPCGFTFTSPVRMPTVSAPKARVKSLNFWFESALSGVVYAMRLPVASAMWMANSATSVFPAPVGADTMTDCPPSIARMASSWKSSSGNGYRARNCSSSSITRHSITSGRLHPRGSYGLRRGGEVRRGLYSTGRAMIVYHVAITAAADYATRREAYRRSHIERLQGLRAAGILICGGPAPDGKTADIFYRLQQPGQLKNAIEEDPYWTGGVWTRYEPRSFAQFVEPWEMVPVVLDGSRKVTIVEGPVTDHAMEIGRASCRERVEHAEGARAGMKEQDAPSGSATPTRP